MRRLEIVRNRRIEGVIESVRVDGEDLRCEGRIEALRALTVKALKAWIKSIRDRERGIKGGVESVIN